MAQRHPLNGGDDAKQTLSGLNSPRIVQFGLRLDV
jgi:hypothetical protein